MTTADGATATEDVAAEVARLRAERDEARAELESLKSAPGPRHGARRVAVAVLLVISCLSFLTGGVGIWASRNLLDTDVWVSRVGPLIEDQAVRDALSREITTEVMSAVDPKALFEEALPERGQMLAAPLSSAVQSFVGDEVDKVVASDAFARLWVEANREAHTAVVKVLRDDSEVVDANSGSVTLDLIPVINRVLQRLTSVSPELFGKTVDIPDVQIDEVPTAAIDRINSTLGTDLPEDFGQITIYDQGRLKEVQDAVALFERIVWISVAVFVVTTIGAFALSVDRRRTLLQLAVADALLLVVVRRLAIRVQEQVTDLVRVDDNRPAVRAVTSALFAGLFDGTRVLLWMFGTVIVVAVLTGPGPRMTAFRHRASDLIRTLVSSARDKGTEPATAEWVIAHRDALMAGGVLTAVALLWWLSLSWFGVLVLVALLAAYLLALSRLPGEADPSTPETAPAAPTEKEQT